MASSHPGNDALLGPTTAIDTQHAVASPARTPKDAAIPLRTAKVEKIPKPSDDKAAAISDVHIPDAETRWRFTQLGRLIIPSPIRILPKPLALSYCNFYNYYEKYQFSKREKLKSLYGQEHYMVYPRAVVGCTLVSSLLRHHFSQEDFAVRDVTASINIGVESAPQQVIDGVPLDGMRLWVAQSKSDNAIVTLLVVVTDPVFATLPGRTLPIRHAVATNFLNSSHQLALHGGRMSRGTVIPLSSAGTPVKPRFEFYSFDSTTQQPHALVPMAIRLGNNDISATNSMSLAPGHVQQVGQMFKDIVRALTGQGSWPQVLSPVPVPIPHLSPASIPVSSSPEPPVKGKRKHGTTAKADPKAKRPKTTASPDSSQTATPTAPTNEPPTPVPTGPSSPTLTDNTAGPTDRSSRHRIEVKNMKTRKMEHHDISEAYVRTVKENASGNLITENGKMITNGKSRAIRIVAKKMDHTFIPPTHSSATK